jgi:hypothetical protein
MKRYLSLILALLMLASSMTLLFSCSKKEDDKKTDTNKNDAPAQLEEDSIFYERSLVEDGVETVDYGGRDFRIVTHITSEFDIPEEEQNKGDLMKDAKFKRNQVVENRFNINMKVAYTGTYSEVSSWVSKTVLSGADEFDLLMGMIVDTGKLVAKQLFLNWYDIEHIDFSKPWWAASNTTDLTYNGVCPLAVSDFTFTSITSIKCLIVTTNMSWIIARIECNAAGIKITSIIISNFFTVIL